MSVPESVTSLSSRTLAQRLAEGRIPVADALRYAMMIAESLRKLHDAGTAHGAVAPGNIVLSANSVELSPPRRTAEVTPYSAPEMIHGRPAEAASDVFSFGAVLYEMLAGRRAFDGITSAAVAAAIQSSQPPSLGSPVVDRLIASCLAKDPAARCRMQKILMELKLYSVAVRKAEVVTSPRHSAEVGAQVQQLEARVAARLQLHESKVSEIERAASQALDSIRGQVAAANAELAAAKDRSSRVEMEIQAFGERIVARVQQSVDGISGRITAMDQGLAALSERVGRLEKDMAHVGAMGSYDEAIATVGQRMTRLEEGIQAVQKHASELHDAIAEDMQSFETVLKQQAASIESARTAMAQTDDLVERVVEALESLQSTVLEQSEDRTVAVN